LQSIFEKPFLPSGYGHCDILIQLIIYGPQPPGLGNPKLCGIFIWIVSAVLEMSHCEVPHDYDGEDDSAQIHVHHSLCEERLLLLGDPLMPLGWQKGLEEDLREEIQYITCEEQRAEVLCEQVE
jgi:hypothetical protein